MVDASRIGKLLEALANGIQAHDRANPDHNAWGIGMAHFDIERLGLEDGEQILPGIVLQADGGQTGAFRVLCDGRHDEELEEEEEIVEAIGSEQEIEEPIYAPAGPGTPPPVRPPV
jgi:hypothetical protein